MSCLRLGSLIHRKNPPTRAHQATKKKGYHDSEPYALETQPPGAPKGRQAARPAPRATGRRFAAAPEPPAPGETPTPMPSRPPAASPGGIPDIGSEAPEAISYPSTAEQPADASLGGNWCCCCGE